MGRAEEVEALANECAAVWTYIGGHLIEVGERRGGLASLDLERTEQALREYAQLLRDTRPRFDGGARSQEDDGRREVTRMIGPTGWHDEDRCAPLVEALRNITGAEESSPWQEAYQAAGGRYEGLQAIALTALRAHRERSGDG